MFNYGGSPTLTNCKFSCNSARGRDGNGSDRINGEPAYGGGLYSNGGNPSLTECMFTCNAVRGGNNSGSHSTDGIGGPCYGGGMYCKSNNLKVINCTFSNNLALGGNGNNYVSCVGGNGYGGGLYQDSGTLVLIGSVFNINNATGGAGNNAGGYGAGLYCQALTNASEITSCMFSTNTSIRGTGAGVYFASSNPIVSECTFTNNKGGGIYCAVSSPTINNCVISGNYPSLNGSSGGGMYNTSSSNPSLTNCLFTNNSAGSGGGMYNYSGNPHLTNCIFKGNSSTDTYNGGGGMYIGGGSPTLVNCEFSANSAAYVGAGISLYYGSVTLTNCIFSGNSSTNNGGGIAGSICTVTTKNCTFVNNSASNGRAIAPTGVSPTGSSNFYLTNCILWDGGSEIAQGVYSHIYMTYSDIQGGFSGTGNINTDPLFVSGYLGNYYLSQTTSGQVNNSPCVNTGSATAASLGLDTYTTRTDEFQDQGAVDIGYHYIIQPRSPDIDENGHVDLLDYSCLAADWLVCDNSYPLAGDIDKDKCVNTNDLGLLADAWLDCYVISSTNPSPADNATNIDRICILRWTVGSGALHHDVFFGTDINDVNNADTASPAYHGRQDSTSWTTNYDPCGLNFYTTYYWRIDEVGPACTTKGSLWRFTTGHSACGDCDPNLVGWWKLDDSTGTTAYDSARSNDGALNGNPVWTAGQINGALDFSGDDGVYINGSAGKGSPLNRYNSDITICAWVKIRGSGGAVVARAKSGAIAYLLATNATAAYIDIYNGDHYTVSTPAILSLDTWYHIVGVFDRTGHKGRVYVNGTKQAEAAMTTNPASNDATTKIGCRNSTTDMAFNGVIDDVRIYNKALSAQEIHWIINLEIANWPNPAIGQQNVGPEIILSWAPGRNAVSHDVYFGTSFSDVNASITPLAVRDVNNYDPCGLNYGTTYYWRIDEFDGTDTYKGDVWSFTVVSGKAVNPSPSNGAGSVDLNTILGWSAAPYATSHDIYFSTSFNDVNSSTTPVTTTGVNSYNPGGLAYSTTYYWRIDEYDGTVIIKGDVWSFTTWPQLDPNLGLVAWWKFDEPNGTIAHDSAGTNNGTLNGNPVWATGQINGALSFDGVDDYVSTSSVVMINKQNITMAGWVYWNDTSANSVLFYNGNTGANGYGVFVNNGACATGNKIVVLIGGRNCNAVSSSTILPTNIWTHIALTREGTAWKLYVNGVYKHTGTTEPYALSGNTLIGAGSAPNNFFNGMIDDVRVYNRALSATEVQQLYEAGLP